MAKFQPVKPANRGLLHKKMGVPAGQKIPTSALQEEKETLQARAKKLGKLSAADLKRLREVQFALTAKNWKH